MMPAKEIWCLTLPLREERPLTDDERRALRRQLHGAAAFSVAGFVLTLLVTVVWLVLLGLAERHTSLLFTALIAGPVGIGACFLMGYHGLKRAMLAQRELRHGAVQCFAGRFADDDQPYFANAIVRYLTKAGFTLADENVVEVYSGTGRLLRVNQMPYRGWNIVLGRSETAHTPEFAAVAAQWLEKVGETENGEAIQGGQRELSPSEQDELRKSAFIAWWRPLRWPLLLALWPALLAIVALASRQSVLGPSCWLLVILLVSAVPIKRGIAFAGKLVAAIRAGSVIIIKYPLQADATTDMVVEMLPGSEIAWTINAIPAVWRRI